MLSSQKLQSIEAVAVAIAIAADVKDGQNDFDSFEIRCDSILSANIIKEASRAADSKSRDSIPVFL